MSSDAYRDRAIKQDRQLKNWRNNGPWRKWRLSQGLTVQGASVELGIAGTTYQRWEYGNGIPKIQKDKNGRLYAKVNVQEGPREPKKEVDFDEYIFPRTGISLARFINWFAKRPKFGMKI